MKRASDDCWSALYRATLNPGTNNSPDVALLRERGPCFKRGEGPDIDVEAFTLDNPETYHRRRVSMKLGSAPTGKIERTCGYAAYGERIHRFPHVMIAPLMLRWRNLIELTPWRFSKPGDSGSWVFSTDTRQWVGVVTGGHEGLRTTDAIEAEALLEYLRRLPSFSDITGSYVEGD